MSLSTDNLFGDEIVLRSIDWMEKFPWRQENGSRINKDKYEISLNVKDFAPEEISVKVSDGYIVVEGRHERKDELGYISTRFLRRYPVPDDCVQDKVESTLSTSGILTVVAPRKALVKCSTVIPVQHTKSTAKSKL